MRAETFHFILLFKSREIEIYNLIVLNELVLFQESRNIYWFNIVHMIVVKNGIYLATKQTINVTLHQFGGS